MPWAVLADQETKDTDAILEMIASQSARVTAVVGGALLDEHIRRTLAERLRKSTQTDRLLDVPRALSLRHGVKARSARRRGLGPTNGTRCCPLF